MTGHAAGGRRRYQLGVGNGGQARAGASDSDDEGSGVEGRQRVQRWHAHYRQRRGRRQQLRDACRVRATRSLSGGGLARRERSDGGERRGARAVAIFNQSPKKAPSPHALARGVSRRTRDAADMSPSHTRGT